MNSLFAPLALGAVTLRNRIIMAPMTRRRADANGIPNELAPLYYAQRASAGLIISEGTHPSAMGVGLLHAPGIYSDAHVTAWRRVTDAVHDKGGCIFLQIMHCGRASHPSLLPNGALPVAPSALQPPGETRTRDGMKPRVVPRALETGEIAGVIAEYRRSTERAFEAGFDGVELHAASGFLPEQFLCSRSNQRTDRYGGSIDNRCRFILEALGVMSAVRGAARVGIKLSPDLGLGGVLDDTPDDTYSHLTRALAPLGLAYLYVADGKPGRPYHALMRPLFPGPFFAGAGFMPEEAIKFVADSAADAISFGKLFVSNPDLPARLEAGVTPVEPDTATYYTDGAKGYVDYPAMSA